MSIDVLNEYELAVEKARQGTGHLISRKGLCKHMRKHYPEYQIPHLSDDDVIYRAVGCGYAAESYEGQLFLLPHKGVPDTNI